MDERLKGVEKLGGEVRIAVDALNRVSVRLESALSNQDDKSKAILHAVDELSKRVDEKFRAVRERLDEHDARAERHENEVSSLKTWRYYITGIGVIALFLINKLWEPIVALLKKGP